MLKGQTQRKPGTSLSPDEKQKIGKLRPTDSELGKGTTLTTHTPLIKGVAFHPLN